MWGIPVTLPLGVANRRCTQNSVENMAAPDMDVSNQGERNKAPVKIEDLTKEETAMPEEPRPPWKGVLVQCSKLWNYLSGIPTFERANMLRKGREVHKIYVEVMKGKTFLDDQFSLTEFGRMVLQNGSIRAGRAKNAKQIVVARETLYCSGSGVCKRACGGHGQCVIGCEKTKMRGHKCSYRVKLTMRLGFVNHWFVEVLGDHDQFQSLSDRHSGPPSNVSIDEDSHGSQPSPGNSTKERNGGSPPGTLLPDVHSSDRDAGTTSEKKPKNLHSVSNLQKHLITSQPMNLPVNLPNSVLTLPVVTDIGLYPSPYSVAASALFNGASGEMGYPTMAPINYSTQCQDVPLPLVKVKRDPESEVSEKASDGMPSPHSNGYGSSREGHSPSPDFKMQERAKARKQFNPSQMLTKDKNNMFDHHRPIITAAQAEAAVSVGMHRGELDLHVKKELRDLVTRREMDRSSYHLGSPTMGDAGSRFDVSDSISLSTGSDENSRSSYNYVWDGEMSEHPGDDDHAMEVVNEEKVARLLSKHVHGSCVPWKARSGKDLITRVRQLESHVNQLRNVVLKSQSDPNTKQSRKKQREFDFKKYNTRHVALKILYLGWDFHGFAVQEDTEKTIETALFDALMKTKLIESRETSNYHRCGRTDKGVSAFGQVISIDLRSNLLEGVGVKKREGGLASERQGDKTTEIRYVHILNKVLPPEIRVLAWTPVHIDFSARFDCKKRTYKYIFPRGNLDLAAMTEGAKKLIGEHDFRNLCKMDVGNGVVNYKRRILSVDISVLDERDHGYQMIELTVVGLAFLWHQIRCIVALLYMIGCSKEKPEVIDDLLNTTKHPKKPQYTMASELPLVLFDCEYTDDVEWMYEPECHEENIKHLQQLWAQHAVKTSMLMKMLEEMDQAKVETDCDIAPWQDLRGPIFHQNDWLIPGNKGKVHKRLLERQTCESLEERLEHFAKRKKTSHINMSQSSPQETDPSIPSSVAESESSTG